MGENKSVKEIIFKIYAISLIVGFVVVIANPSIASSSVERGMVVCANIIIPPIFLSSIVSNLLYYTGALKVLSPLIKGISKLFNVSFEGAQIFLISMLGGYPSGAALIKEAVKLKTITAEEAKKLSLFCLCGGPAFIIGAVGYKIFSNISFGIVLYICSVISNMTVALLLRGKGPQSDPKGLYTHTTRSFSECLISSVNSAVSSLLPMCGFIIFFTSVNYFVSAFGVFDKFGEIFDLENHITRLISAAFFSASEVTSGTLCAKEIGGYIGALLCAFCVSFSGICIHFQVYSLLSDIKISRLRFLLSRFISATITTLFLFPILLSDDGLVPVLSVNKAFTLSYNSLISSFFIILLSVSLVFSVKSNSFTE